jgi:hypothetical protein
VDLHSAIPKTIGHWLMAGGVNYLSVFFPLLVSLGRVLFLFIRLLEADVYSSSISFVP